MNAFCMVHLELINKEQVIKMASDHSNQTCLVLTWCCIIKANNLRLAVVDYHLHNCLNMRTGIQ